MTFASAVDQVDSLLSRQARNTDSLYEEKLNIMENLRKSFEIFCSSSTEGSSSNENLDDSNYMQSSGGKGG